MKKFLPLFFFLLASPCFAHNVALTWTASISDGVGSYNIYRIPCAAPVSSVGGAQPGSCSGEAAVVGSTTGTSFTDASVQAGESYEYYVTAVCSTCQTPESDPSETWTATIPPAAPTGLTAPEVK